MDIIKVNVFVAPLEVVNDSFICEFFLENKDILEKVQNSLLNIEVIELGNHSFLVFKVSLILVNQRIPFVNDTADVIEYRCVRTASRLLKACKLILKGLIFALLSHKLLVHITDLSVIFIQLTHDHLIVLPTKFGYFYVSSY